MPGRRLNSSPRLLPLLSLSLSLTSPLAAALLRSLRSSPLCWGNRKGMLQAVRYLLGSPGATGFGSKSTAEEVTAACPDLGALTAIITGATSGIGAETARVLAKRGARVVIPARNVKAAEDMRARILADGCPAAADVLVLPLDLSSLASVRAFADRFLALGLPLHLLINNAGKFSHGQLALSEDGVEMTFATNYLGHFLLTKLLLGRMEETAAATGVQGRIVNVSSSVHGWFAGDWAEYLHLVTRRKIPYDATQAYAVSKLANVLHTRELAARLQETGANVTVNCVHPGIVRTRLNRDRDGVLTDLVFLLLSKLLKTIPQAAATTCYVATHPRVAGVSGRYFADCNETLPSPAATKRSEAARLWHISEAIIDAHHRSSTAAPPPPLLFPIIPAQAPAAPGIGAGASPRRTTSPSCSC